jgi:hypothetical protein
MALNNIFQNWLTADTSKQGYVKFTHIPLTENADLRNQIFSELAQLVFVYHNDPDEFKELVEKLGYKVAISKFNKRPAVDKVRKGNFGEIIACEYLKHISSFDIPVFRLRWNPNPDTSMRGEDALAFKLDKSGKNEICIVESKVVSQFNSDTVSEAHGQLKLSIKSIPFVYSKLRESGEIEKANAILELLNPSTGNSPKRSNFLMLVTGNVPENPFKVIEEIDDVVGNLLAANLYLVDLTDFINRLFEEDINANQ